MHVSRFYGAIQPALHNAVDFIEAKTGCHLLRQDASAGAPDRLAAPKHLAVPGRPLDRSPNE